MASHVARLVATVHACGVVHGDLALDNFWVDDSTPDCCIKISGFSSAHVLSDGKFTKCPRCGFEKNPFSAHSTVQGVALRNVRTPR